MKDREWKLRALESEKKVKEQMELVKLALQCVVLAFTLKEKK